MQMNQAQFSRLAAALGATSLTRLPDRWQPPWLEVGQLPAHVQTSPTPTTGLSLSDLIEKFSGTNNCTRFNGDTSLTLNLVLRTSDGRQSNPLTATIAAPAGAQAAGGGAGSRG